MEIYDIVIENGTITDPEKNIIFKNNIGIINDKIAIITNKKILGKITIDAINQIVSPGFVDIHSHIDGNIGCAELSVLQGVTTVIGGNCGISPLNLKDFFNKQDSKGFPINQGELIGHSFGLRKKAGIRSPYIAATAKEIEVMCKLTEEAFEQGALGLSFGLEYAPGSSFEEVIALSKIATKYKKIIPIHTNLTSSTDLDSLKEAIKIAEITGAHVLISHFVYQFGTGIMTEALDIVDEARGKGLQISVDSGMYTAFATGIKTAVYDEKSIEKFGWKLENLLVATGKYKGERLNENLYKELRKHHKNESIVCFTGIEEEIYEALKKDYVMLSSDTGPSPSGLTNEGHPQNAGTFVRFFRKMVREQNSISLIKAIEKCTLIPANTLQLKSKGRLSEGMDADIVVFDINRISDNSDFPGIGQPDAKPSGIGYVIVNGKIVVKEGNIIKGSLPGKSIRGSLS